MQRRAAGIGLLTGFLLLSSGLFSVWAQCATSTSFTGSLRVMNQAGCVPLTVQASSDLIGVQNVRYVYEYDGKRESPVTNAGTYTYKKPGLYQILQLSEKEGLPLRACTSVMVYDTLPPKVELTACGSQVTLRVADRLTGIGRYDYLLIRWGDGRLDTLTANPATTTHTFTDNARRQIHVQGVHRYSQCGGTTVQPFEPDKPVAIHKLEPNSRQTVRLSIDNSSGSTLSVQQRVGSGPYATLPATPTGTAPTVEVPVDSLLTTCFRLVPTADCPGQSPSAEVCYTPPPPNSAATDVTYLPDAFSPNNDGVNDTFGPVGAMPLGLYQLTIVDRWGRVVFSTDDSRKTWDGLTDSRPAPAGTYAYQLRMSLVGGQSGQKSGRFQLIR